MKYFMLVLMVCAGCEQADPIAERGADEERARDIVWREFLKEEFPAPRVVWGYDVCPDKPDLTAIMYKGQCYAGVSYAYYYRSFVAWRGSYSSSAYAHELFHMHLGYTFGDSDHDHKGPLWARENEVNALLEQEGL